MFVSCLDHLDPGENAYKAHYDTREMVVVLKLTHLTKL